MKQMTFAEINDFENGQQISGFQGTVKKVFEQKSGEGNYGPWTLQNIILMDEHANEITVTWSGEDPWTTSEEGKRYVFESGQDKKDQLCGLKKEIRIKGDKRYESVKVDPRAKIRPIDYEPEPAPIAPGSSVQAPNGNPVITDARKHLMQAANLLNLCVDAVNLAIAPHVPPIAQTSEFFQAQVATLFIEASRAGYVSKMPSTPLKK